MRTVQKVVAYITNGRALLVFDHVDFPEAGVQVPAGTVEPGESLEQAVLREAREETGLAHLELGRYLGTTVSDMRQFGRHEFHERHFFHLINSDPQSGVWVHVEADPSDGGVPIRLQCRWTTLHDTVPELTRGLNAFLAELQSAGSDDIL